MPKKTQKGLKGDCVPAAPRMLDAHLQTRHDTQDLITGKRNITLYGRLRDENKKDIGGFNININGLNEDEWSRFMNSLGELKLTKRTPLYMTITIPEGAILDDWNQAHLEEKAKEDKKKQKEEDKE